MKENSKKRPYTVHGKIKYFSKKEIEAILEEHIPKETFLPEMFETAEKPTEGKCFKVELGKIELAPFLKERSDERQEWTRNIILEAIIEALKTPEKYDVFYILIPEKKWVYEGKEIITIEQVLNFAERVGGYTTTWIEKALEWAQRITNGESWESVCNDPDTVKLYQLIIWKNSKIRLVGGASELHLKVPASDVNSHDYNPNNKIADTVPSVVLKSSLHCSL